MIDLLEEKVKIKNYANDIMYKAFGKNDHLNLPFYDPFLIIKKTEGRMAEDDFWIRIEE